jgi:hypothetical protein
MFLSRVSPVRSCHDDFEARAEDDQVDGDSSSSDRLEEDVTKVVADQAVKHNEVAGGGIDGGGGPDGLVDNLVLRLGSRFPAAESADFERVEKSSACKCTDGSLLVSARIRATLVLPAAAGPVTRTTSPGSDESRATLRIAETESESGDGGLS